MIMNSKIRHNSRLRMRGKWSSALTIFAVTTAVTLFLSLALEFTTYLLTTYKVQLISPFDWNTVTGDNILNALIPFFIAIPVLLIMIFIYNPLQMGEASFYWHNANNRDASAQCVLEWFHKKRYCRAVGAMFLVRVYEVLWGILCFLPTLLVYPLAYVYLKDTKQYSDVLMATCLMFMAMILLGVGLYAFLRVIQRYFLVPYLMASDENLKAGEALRASKAAMAGKSARVLHFQFTFLGWFFLCIFVLPLIYVIPYFRQACAEYARTLLGGEAEQPVDAQAPYQQNANPQFGGQYPNYSNGYNGVRPPYPYNNNYPSAQNQNPNAYGNGYYGTQYPNPYSNGYYGAQNPNAYRNNYGTQNPNPYGNGYYGAQHPNQYNNGYYGAQNPNPYYNNYGTPVPPVNPPQGYYNPYNTQPPIPPSPSPYQNPDTISGFAPVQDTLAVPEESKDNSPEPSENPEQNN